MAWFFENETKSTNPGMNEVRVTNERNKYNRGVILIWICKIIVFTVSGRWEGFLPTDLLGNDLETGELRMRERGTLPSKLSTRSYPCINLCIRWDEFCKKWFSIEVPLLLSIWEARICPGVGHVAWVMRDRGQTRGWDGNTRRTQPVSHSDTSIQLAATPRPLYCPQW